MILASTRITALPELSIKESPEWQEGDDEIINGVVTLGEMRQAIYYKEVFEEAIIYGQDMKEIAEDALRIIDERDLEIKREKEKSGFLGGVCLFLGGVAIASVISSIVE